MGFEARLFAKPDPALADKAIEVTYAGVICFAYGCTGPYCLVGLPDVRDRLQRNWNLLVLTGGQ